jgi:hypothetical protein
LRFKICQLLRKDIESIVEATKIVWEEFLKDRVKETEQNEAIVIKDDEDGLPKVDTIEESNAKEITVAIMVSLPLSLVKALTPPNITGEKKEV